MEIEKKKRIIYPIDIITHYGMSNDNDITKQSKLKKYKQELLRVAINMYGVYEDIPENKFFTIKIYREPYYGEERENAMNFLNYKEGIYGRSAYDKIQPFNYVLEMEECEVKKSTITYEFIEEEEPISVDGEEKIAIKIVKVENCCREEPTSCSN